MAFNFTLEDTGWEDRDRLSDDAVLVYSVGALNPGLSAGTASLLAELDLPGIRGGRQASHAKLLQYRVRFSILQGPLDSVSS